MIALYPGAYKPPHRGHFNVVKSLLDNSYNGSIYTKDNYKEKGSALLSGELNKKPSIDKVIVFVGAGERNGITKEESMSIWNIYSKYLGNVEILDGQKNPMFAAKDYAQANPDQEFVSVTGIRGDKDFVDLRRITTFKNAPNVQGLALAAAPGSGIRATDFRNSILAGNLDSIIDFFPKELDREEILGILDDLKEKIVAEILSSNISGFIDNYFSIDENKNERIERAITSVSRDKINNLYNFLSRLIPSDTSINLNQDSIVVKFDEPLNEGQRAPELKEYIASLLEYMLDEKMNITPLPEVKLRKDDANASNFFGRTAYYDPNQKEIVLFVSGRHNKDIVRSFSHEMVHHIQNIENRLPNISTQNTNKDDRLLELEKEAYLVGNITFRNWEDSLKNSEKQSPQNEGRYDTIGDKEASVDELESLLNRWSAYSGQYDLLPDIAKLAKNLGVNNGPSIVYRAVPGLDEYPYTKQEVTDYDKEQEIVATTSTREQAEYFITDNADWAYILEYKPHIIINFDEFEEKYGWTGNWGEGEILIDVTKSKLVNIEDYTKKQSINEGRYDTISNKLSSIAFEAFKDIHDRGDTSGSFSFRVDHPEEEHDIPAKEFYFDFEGYVEITDDIYQPDGGANAGFDNKGESITPMLSLKFRIPKNPTTNPSWEDISFDLKDVVRHEIEHLTQDGDNLKGGVVSDDPKLERPSKYMKDDQLLRDLIDADLLDKSQYYKLEKEVDAMLQGLYFKAKKSKQPFKEVIDDYLDKVNLTDKEKKEVLEIWRKRRPALSLPVFEDKQSSDPKFILSDEVNLISKELIETLKNNF